MIIGVSDAKLSQAQARRLAVPGGLQHVLRCQRSSGFVTQGKRILQELDDVGLGLQVRRTVPVLYALGYLIAGKR